MGPHDTAWHGGAVRCELCYVMVDGRKRKRRTSIYISYILFSWATAKRGAVDFFFLVAR